jgi:sec-independent protein translocase protein TatA
MSSLLQLASFANLFSPGDMFIILLIVLVLFGAKKLPELAKGMGQAIREFQKAKDDVEREVTKSTAGMTVEKPAQTLEHNPASPAAPAPAPTDKTV